MTPADDTCRLSWTGPFSWLGPTDSLFVSAPAGGGVYVWALPYEDAYLPYYVGETGVSLAERSRDHLQCYCSGMYTIFEAPSFREARKQVVWKGTVYSSQFGPRLSEFMQRLPELVGHVHGILDALRVFFAPLDVDKRTLRRVEGRLAGLLAEAEAPYGTFQDEGLQYATRNGDEPPILVTVEGAPNGFVLPNSFEA
jgi:hypothetical protein